MQKADLLIAIDFIFELLFSYAAAIMFFDKMHSLNWDTKYTETL